MGVTALSAWGLAGVEALRDRVAALVIVDVLSFSTAVDVAVARGAFIVPFPSADRKAARTAACAAGALLAEPRGGDGLSLSPHSLTRIAKGTRLLLPSLNGSRLSLAGGPATVFAGCLRNAKAVARAAAAVAGNGAVGVVAAGELGSDGRFRHAVEDLLGAGAILHALDRPLSAGALAARDAFRTAAPDIATVVRGSISGQELIRRGFAEDVEIAVARDVSIATPVLREGVYRAEA